MSCLRRGQHTTAGIKVIGQDGVREFNSPNTRNPAVRAKPLAETVAIIASRLVTSGLINVLEYRALVVLYRCVRTKLNIVYGKNERLE